MIYRVIGLMSGSSLDGLDIVFASFQEIRGSWSYEILETLCDPYPTSWTERLRAATELKAFDYQLLHAEYGHYLGKRVNAFIEERGLQYKVALIASHGHTTFHVPDRGMTAQLGDGASLAAETRLPVVSDLRALDLAFGGQGAPIVPIGERLLFGGYSYFLNIGGIANISVTSDPYQAFDVCPANRVLNLLASDTGSEFDRGGRLAASGRVIEPLLNALNDLDYYHQAWPKSLANSFGTDVVYPIIKSYDEPVEDLLRTYVEHIAIQVSQAVSRAKIDGNEGRMMVTGGGAFNGFLIDRLREKLMELKLELEVPDEKLVKFKEALIMALIGILRWRQEYNVLSSVTGSRRDSIGGALWMGQEA